jgi:membrane-bound lytic murein transglycosylase B
VIQTLARTVSLLTCALLLCGTARADYLGNPLARDFIDAMVSQHGFNQGELRGLLKRAERQQAVLDAISRPAEKTLTWAEYRRIFVTDKRTRAGVDFYRENESLLKRAESEFGVAAEVIVAIIGVETFYGTYKGKYPALSTLATLAFDYPPRSKFFRSELEQYLLLAREEQFDLHAIMGSYAAAMGMPQFISSSYRRYAVDFDGDGKRDLWNSRADVIGSVANYFAAHGWQRNQPVTDRCPAKGDAWAALADGKLKPGHRAESLRAAGLSPRGDGPFTVMDFAGEDGRECWIGEHNFYVITRYNHSSMYAMAVWQLGQTIRAAIAEEQR